MVDGSWLMIYGLCFIFNVSGLIDGLPEFCKEAHTLPLPSNRHPSRLFYREARVSGHGEPPEAATATRAFVLRPVKRGFDQLKIVQSEQADYGGTQ